MIYGYQEGPRCAEDVALVLGDPTATDVLVRVHSECLTGDVLGSLRCDCGEQRDRALDAIAANGNGVLVYLRQEGRGIGLINKIMAYRYQDQGCDTVEANLKLGLPVDSRSYRHAAKILQELGVRRLRLLTNNPKKVEELERLGFEVVERVPILAEPNGHNIRYLRAKAQKMGHLLPGVSIS
ncbi:MAG: GTP cyclohydrolase II [Cyanobacteria bacterium REEB65]|nr:GTP cyclohydrolase II [Cyanobacteria bacterium REEB65]